MKKPFVSLLLAVMFMVAHAGLAAGDGMMGEFSLMDNVTLDGMDYQTTEIPTDNMKACLYLCQNDMKCKAFTYVKPPKAGANAQCRLKSGVPPSSNSMCCLSGQRKFAAVPPVNPEKQGGIIKSPNSCADLSIKEISIKFQGYFNGNMHNPMFDVYAVATNSGNAPMKLSGALYLYRVQNDVVDLQKPVGRYIFNDLNAASPLATGPILPGTNISVSGRDYLYIDNRNNFDPPVKYKAVIEYWRTNTNPTPQDCNPSNDSKITPVIKFDPNKNYYVY